MADSIRVAQPIRLHHLHKYTSRILLIVVSKNALPSSYLALTSYVLLIFSFLLDNEFKWWPSHQRATPVSRHF